MNGIPCPNVERCRAEVTFVKKPRLENREWQDQGFVEYRALILPEKYRYFLSLFVATRLVRGRASGIRQHERAGRK